MKKITILMSSLLLCVCDLFIKYLVKTFLTKTVIIIPHFFYLNYTENTGAAWGMLEGYASFLIGIAILCFILLLKEILTKPMSKLLSLAYILVMGGLLGNLFDRLVYGYVTDYLQFIFGSYSFPIFNLADIVIVIGIFLLLIECMRSEAK